MFNVYNNILCNGRFGLWRSSVYQLTLNKTRKYTEVLVEKSIGMIPNCYIMAKNNFSIPTHGRFGNEIGGFVEISCLLIFPTILKPNVYRALVFSSD